MADILNTFTAGQIYYANWRRMGDHHRHALGDMEVECESCDGTGKIETEREGKPWAVELRECPDCRGWGTVWVERDEG